MDNLAFQDAVRGGVTIVMTGHPLDWRSKVEPALVDGEIAYACGAYAGLQNRINTSFGPPD